MNGDTTNGVKHYIWIINGGWHKMNNDLDKLQFHIFRTKMDIDEAKLVKDYKKIEKILPHYISLIRIFNYKSILGYLPVEGWE